MRNRLDRVHGADLPVVTCWPADAEFANVRVWQDANEDGMSDAGELKMLAVSRRMPGRLLVGNRRPNRRSGHPKAHERTIASISVDRVDVTGTNEGNDRGFAATFTRTLLPRLQLPTSNRRGSTGAAETIYFQTDRADTVDPTPEFTPAEGVDKLPHLAGSGNIVSAISPTRARA